MSNPSDTASAGGFRIVLTGGPGSGKTAVAGLLAERNPGRYLVIPEAATQVYQRLDTRWDRLDDAGRRTVQRSIYQMQVEQEARMAPQSRGRVVLLDRGTVDGAAYWPGGADEYWSNIGATHAAELSRYDAAIWLESGAALGHYDGAESNPCRYEDAAESVACGQRLARLWEKHPRFHQVPAFPSLQQKVDAVEAVIGRILAEDRDQSRTTS